MIHERLMTSQNMDTIGDFGRQWENYTENTGYYASTDALISLFGPLLNAKDICGKRVADVGAGTGRYCRMLSELGAAEILAVEPSSAYDILLKNTALCHGIRYLQATADRIPPDGFDMIFCIGVLQFIADPAPALQSMGRALHPDGKLFLWVYGEENNRLYLTLVRPLRNITARLPHFLLDILAGLLVFPADLYAALCRRLRLPMAEYVNRYFSKLDFYSRKLVVYDQLNPKYARYYRQEELKHLLEQCGFFDIRMHHHLGYSWSVSAHYRGC